MSPDYEPRHAPPTSLPGGAPRAFFRWEGTEGISKAAFDALPARPERVLERCAHCGIIVKYQVRTELLWMF
jgi:hypothetical protein